MRNLFPILLAIVLFTGCSICDATKEWDDDHYQNIGTAVMTANDFLIADYPDGLPDSVDVEAYKQSLQDEGYYEKYQLLEPLDVRITPSGRHFIVEVREYGTLILRDASCTETYLDCWTYRGQCDPDTLRVPCLEE
ncbi:MAG: hypothetical protein IH600_15660 [Bacteroidetes bacterium]|nr:hypothetical protein [Bacteroidota bacterium]